MFAIFALVLPPIAIFFYFCFEGIKQKYRYVCYFALEKLHIMNYLYQHRNRGIKFSSTGNSSPEAYCDASNKGDPTDSKCQYGYIPYNGKADLSLLRVRSLLMQACQQRLSSWKSFPLAFKKPTLDTIKSIKYRFGGSVARPE